MKKKKYIISIIDIAIKVKDFVVLVQTFRSLFWNKEKKIPGTRLLPHRYPYIHWQKEHYKL
jgi:hypothetical protein